MGLTAWFMQARFPATASLSFPVSAALQTLIGNQDWMGAKNRRHQLGLKHSWFPAQFRFRWDTNHWKGSIGISRPLRSRRQVEKRNGSEVSPYVIRARA